MKTLSENWISEGLIDFEYKKYILLAYLQHVSKHFDEETLYPMLADLIFHHQNLVVIRANQRDANEHFPRELQRLDLEDFTLQYEALMHNDDYIEEIAQIINYAIPKIENCLQTGRNVYDQVENALEIQPVGIVPINAEAGYLLLVNGRHTQTNVFAYQLSFFENANEKFRAMRTQYIDAYQPLFSNTYEAIKLDLVKRQRDLPNPATFVIASTKAYPLAETLLPVAKRTLVRYLYSNFRM